MSTMINELLETEKKAELLFEEVERRELIFPGKTEKDLNDELFELAFELFGIKDRWTKRLVRAGKHTMDPYGEISENLYLEADDLLSINLGPVFETWGADYGKMYVLGSDPHKLKLKHDVELAWQDTKAFFDHHTSISGSELYRYTIYLARKLGWEMSGEIAGYVAGHSPHGRLDGRLYKEVKENYIHPNNHLDMLLPDINGHKKEWILEIHFVNKRKLIGGFAKHLLTVEKY